MRQTAIPVPLDILWRFWSFVESHEEGKCWPWRKQGNRKYGNFTIDNFNWIAHRFSYYIFNGPFDLNLVVRHRCDFTRCVNPDHLLVGTQKDNKQDGVERERNARGSKHGNSSLVEGEVRQIFQLLEDTEMPDAQIAAEFKVTPACINHIRRGKSWSWLK